MARIRTIKPEFFRHLGLYKAEKEEKLPLRLSFAGLWTSCCREGRFKWIPEMLKLDCLPYDDIDFSRVLDALWTRGYIEKYENTGEIYGFIPSWSEHQHINNRESESNLPDPSESNIITRESRVPDASEGEGKGKERKGKEGKGTSSRVNFIPPTIEEVKAYFKENGYIGELAIKFHKSYNVAGWVDSKGNKIRNWKQKAQMVWFKDEGKIQTNNQIIEELN